MGSLTSLNAADKDNDIEWVVPIEISSFFPALKGWIMQQVMQLKKLIPRHKQVLHYSNLALETLCNSDASGLKPVEIDKDTMAFFAIHWWHYRHAQRGSSSAMATYSPTLSKG